MSVRILIGDVREQLRGLPSGYFDCVVTSPPYWGLRDYGVEGQLGLERTLGEHLDTMVDVFREVRRVLKHQGTCWLNYGDCYAAAPNGRAAVDVVNDDRTFRDKPFSTVGAIYDPSGGASGGGVRGFNKGNTGGTNGGRIVAATSRGAFASGDRQSRVESGSRVVAGGMLKPKDLCMIANRLAIALQDDGWFVRSEIVWHKSNPMPESIYDRPAMAHEKVWLLSKNEDYFYNHAAIREPVTGGTHARISQKNYANQHGSERANGGTRADRPMKAVLRMAPGVTPKSAPEDSNIRAKASWHASASTTVVDDRNARNVWTIPSAPFDGEFCLSCRSYFTGKAKRRLRVETTDEERRRYCTCGAHDRWLSHFATFPATLAERCIKAGTPPDACPLCGEAQAALVCGGMCASLQRIPGRVLDPFGGAGTVGLVAQRLGLDATLIELNPDYAEMARARIDAAAPAPIQAEAAE